MSFLDDMTAAEGGVIYGMQEELVSPPRARGNSSLQFSLNDYGGKN